MDEDYMSFIKEHIELDKLLATTNPKYHEKIKKLLEDKKDIMQENGFWADFKLKRINKKIQKLKNKKSNI
jgi:hypothetical protein